MQHAQIRRIGIFFLVGTATDGAADAKDMPAEEAGTEGTPAEETPAETPAQAREVCESVRPRLVVAPIDGAPGELLKAWSQTAPPAVFPIFVPSLLVISASTVPSARFR